MDTNNDIFTHILIIGNGFDLKLGLKTSYTDFIKSDEFNELINQKNIFAQYLKDKHDLQNWVDIENELKNISNIKIRKVGQDYESSFVELVEALMKFLNKIKYDKLNKDTSAYKVIEKVINEDYLIIDFNYTDTTEVILKELGMSEGDIKLRLIKIHGSLKEGGIIFGVEDQADIKSEDIFLRKAYSPHFRRLNINHRLIQARELFIYGHSLGETDHTYFKSFFSKFNSFNNDLDNNQKITLYFFGNVGRKQLYTQLETLTFRNLSILKNNVEFIEIDSSKE